jgi:hypothetical protein
MSIQDSSPNNFSRDIKPSEDIAWILRDRPLLVGEVDEEYDALFFNIAEAVRPDDSIEWLFIKDIADLSWELKRLQRSKTIINNAVIGEALQGIAVKLRIVDAEREAKQAAAGDRRIFYQLYRKQLEKILDGTTERQGSSDHLGATPPILNRRSLP